MRALAVLGLGLAHDRASIPEVASIARAMDAGNVARAAAAQALGELGADEEMATLLTLAQGTDPLPRQTALVAMARMLSRGPGETPQTRPAVAAMADALFPGGDVESPRARASSQALSRAGAAALVVLASKTPGASSDALATPDGNVEVEPMLESMLPGTFTEQQGAAAFVKFADAIQRAALGALQTSADRSRSVLDALGGGEGELQPLLGREPVAGTEAAHARARVLSKELEPSIVPLGRHPDPSIRMKALVLLSHGSSEAAGGALVLALEDASEAVQRVALGAIGGRSGAPDRGALGAVGKLLASHENWAMRVLSAQAIGRLGAAGSKAEAARALEDAASKDPYALVREAALRALVTFDAEGAKRLAARMAASDAEPRVREVALALSH